MRSSSKRFIWIDLAHVHTCKGLKIKSIMPWRLIVVRIVVSLICFIHWLILLQSMIMTVVLSTGRSQVFLLASICTGCNGPSVHPFSLSQSIPWESTISSYMWYFLATPSKFIMCYLYSYSKCSFYVSVFSSWGSSRELDITCDSKVISPLFHPVLMDYVLTWNNPRAALEKYKYNSPFSSAQWKSEKSALNIGQWWNQGERGAYSLL